MQADQLIKYLPPIQNKLTVLADNALNEDIIKAIIQMIPDATAEVKALAPKFKRADAKQTAFAIWYFLRNRAKYVRDKSDLQLIRTPKRFIFDTHHKSNSGDCKSFALLTVSILRSLGLPAFLRFAGYEKNKMQPSHVYAYTLDPAGNEIIIDGCYPFFNREKKYFYHENHNTMKVASLSGIDGKSAKAKKFLDFLNPQQKQIIIQRLKLKNTLQKNIGAVLADDYTGDQYAAVLGLDDDVIGKLSPEEKKKRKAKRKAKAMKGLKAFGRGVAFVTLGIGRGAYLALVALNINGMATKFKKLQAAKDPKNPKKSAFDVKIIPFWKKIGGIPKLLTKAITAGAKHKPLFLSKKAKGRYAKQFGVGSCEYIGDIEGINAIPVAAAAAAAIPVIAAIIPVMIKAFSSIGKKKEVEELAAQGSDMVQEQKQTDAPGSSAGAQQDAAFNEAAQQVDEITGVHGADFSTLFESLGQVAAVGVQKLGQAIDRKTKKNPKARKAVEKVAQAGDDYFSGAYLRQTGVTPRLKQASGMMDKAQKYLPFVAAAAVGAYFLKSKSK